MADGIVLTAYERFEVELRSAEAAAAEAQDIMREAQLLVLTRKLERALFAKHDGRPPAEGSCWYLVSARWLAGWAAWLRDVDADAEVPRPPPVSNVDLFEDDGGGSRSSSRKKKSPPALRQGLLLSVHYRAVNAVVYHVMRELYGVADSRQELARYSPDVYVSDVRGKHRVAAARDAARTARADVALVRAALRPRRRRKGGGDGDSSDDDMDGGEADASCLFFCCSRRRLECIGFHLFTCCASLGSDLQGYRGVRDKEEDGEGGG